MSWSKRGKRVGWVCTAISAGGICLSPVLAQQVSPLLIPEPLKLGDRDYQNLPTDKDVTLDANGNIRVSVRTSEGQPLQGARVVIIPYKGGESKALRMATTGQ